MNTLTLNSQRVSSGFRVDVSRGERIGRVSLRRRAPLKVSKSKGRRRSPSVFKR
ncbi:hypothetical protein [Rhizobium binxianense]